MIIQPRDKRLLADLHRYGILSSVQIQKTVFKDIHYTAVMRRLRKLEKGNYITRIKGLPLNQSGWALSSQGAEKIGQSSYLKYQNQNTTHHEVLLSEVRLGLERLGLGSDFVTEASLRKQEEGTRHYRAKAQNIIPDGIFVAEASGQTAVVAVELELQPKNHARYEKVFADYASKTAIRYVWYIAGSEDVAKAVWKLWHATPKFQSSPELLLSYAPEFFRDPSGSRIWSQDGMSRRFVDFFECGPSVRVSTSTPSKATAESACLPRSQCELIGNGHAR